jgi:hypothetical protein
MFNFAIAQETLSALMTGKYLSKRTSIIRLSYFCASLLEFYASISSFREIKIVTQLDSEVCLRIGR